jgi:hypothetical protein
MELGQVAEHLEHEFFTIRKFLDLRFKHGSTPNLRIRATRTSLHATDRRD